MAKDILNHNLYTLTPNQAKEALKLAFLTKGTPFLKSSPGLGKSSIIHQIAEEHDLAVIDIRLSTYDPTDLNA